MKRTNKIILPEGPPVVGKCAGCGRVFHSRFEQKRHWCRETEQ